MANSLDAPVWAQLAQVDAGGFEVFAGRVALAPRGWSWSLEG